MKKFISILCITLVVAGCTASEVPKDAAYDISEVAASFRGEPIFKSEVETRESDEDLKFTEYSALELILIDRVVFAGAQERGLSVSPREIDAYMESLKSSYLEYPESIDNDRLSRGLSIDEYWTIVEEAMPLMIMRSKLQSALLKDYYGHADWDVHANEWYLVIDDIFDAYVQELLVKYANDINIYDD
jgi:hypothetical protein